MTSEPRIPDPPLTRRTQVLGGRWDVAFSAAAMAGLLQLPLDVLKAIVGAACAMEDSDAGPSESRMPRTSRNAAW